MTTNAFGYNGLDARVSKTDSSGTYGFKRNGAGVTDAVLSDGAATYAPGISERRGGNSKFLHSGMKNADAQSGASANVDSSRTYDAFGNLTGSVGTWSGPFGYAGGFGYQEDPDHGLRLLGHRYYDSSTGRFISKDPIGDGRNWYGYCYNSPILLTDPGGLIPILVPVMIGMLILSISNTGVGPHDKKTQRQVDAELGQMKFDQLLSLTRVPGAARASSRAAKIVEDAQEDWERAKKLIPESWGAGKPNKRRAGTRWEDPKGKRSQNGVRMDRANPASPWPSQQVDHVVVRKGGVVIGRDGKPIKGSIKDDHENAHIPVSEYSRWKSWDQP